MKEQLARDGSWSRLATKITIWSGSTPAFLIAVIVVLVWLISGPIFQYSDTWQLVINTATTIVTFLMVFLIQRTQNKDSLALQLKLNELAEMAKKDAKITQSHSVEEAEARHRSKQKKHR